MPEVVVFLGPNGAGKTTTIRCLLGRVAVPRVRDAVAANLQKLKELLDR